MNMALYNHGMETLKFIRGLCCATIRQDQDYVELPLRDPRSAAERVVSHCHQ